MTGRRGAASPVLLALADRVNLLPQRDRPASQRPDRWPPFLCHQHRDPTYAGRILHPGLESEPELRMHWHTTDGPVDTTQTGVAGWAAALAAVEPGEGSLPAPRKSPTPISR